MEKLLPFSANTEAFGVRASVAREGAKLCFRYELTDPAGEVLGGPVAGDYRGVPRADGLWQRTCFEAFFARKGSPGYWELNVAPDGSAWNLYRFDGYRLPQPPAPSEDFTLERVSAGVSTLACWLAPRAEVGELEVNLCAVVKTKSATHYLSARHAGEKPDFHVRAGFVLKV